MPEAVDYYFDADGDELGFGDSSTYCAEIGDTFTENTQYELVPDGWVLNNNDDCPLDPDNDIDADGICGDEDSCPLDPENDIDGDSICGDVDQYPYCDSPSGYDCSGQCGGDAYIDECGVCDNDSSNDCVQD